MKMNYILIIVCVFLLASGGLCRSIRNPRPSLVRNVPIVSDTPETNQLEFGADGGESANSMADQMDQSDSVPNLAINKDGDFIREAVQRPVRLRSGSVTDRKKRCGKDCDRVKFRGPTGDNSAANNRRSTRLDQRQANLRQARFDARQLAAKPASNQVVSKRSSDEEGRDARGYEARRRGCMAGECGSRQGCCENAGSCDPTGGNSPCRQSVNTQLAQEAACEAQAAQQAQDDAARRASFQVRAQLAEKACQASSSAQAALDGKRVMVDFLIQELADAQELLTMEVKEVKESNDNECIIQQAKCASAKLAENICMTSQQAQSIACEIQEIDVESQEVEEEEDGLLEGTKRKVEELKVMVEEARADLETTCEAAKCAAAAAQQSRQNAMCCKRKRAQLARFP